MKSIKPGRGPSMMSGIAGIGAVVFGVFWTIMAVQMGAPIFFAAFGIIFIVMAIVGVIYNMIMLPEKIDSLPLTLLTKARKPIH